MTDLIKVYAANVNTLDDSELFEKAYKKVPAIRKEKVDRQRFERGKILSLGAGLLLDYALKETGLNPNCVEIVYNENEKPYLKDNEIYFNLSHSEDYAMCAISSSDIGCDIELVKPIDLKIAKRFFAESEYKNIIKPSNESEQEDLFYRYWTLKESFIKNIGMGLHLPLSSFQIVISDDISIVQSFDKQEYHFMEFSDITEYKSAICSTLSVKNVKMNLLDLNNII